ncbi:Transmembrane domain-containing protein [Spironucleus salmonicida]|uniref:Transmembrane domain-containing protein n=1 Tax=Spironucleus salmonicida TaxID=348837 RepID=V6LSY6_9EUKA|nr:Transmembrane domain-containing protein [Spironucleus salmonicida]|eukprot:EST47685.1 Transmembrane domain-containing protein [Spironucleus salmonicida]
MNDLKKTSYIWTIQRLFLLLQIVSAFFSPIYLPIIQKFNNLLTEQQYQTFAYYLKAINFFIHSFCLVLFQSHPNLQFVIIIAYLQRILVPPITCIPASQLYSYVGSTCFFGILGALFYRLSTHRFELQRLKLKVRAARVINHQSFTNIRQEYYLKKHEQWQKRKIYQNSAAILLLLCQIATFSVTRRSTKLNLQIVKQCKLGPNWSDHLFLVTLLLKNEDSCVHGSFLFSYCFSLGLIIFNSIFAPFFNGDKIGEQSEKEDDLWTEEDSN